MNGSNNEIKARKSPMVLTKVRTKEDIENEAEADRENAAIELRDWDKKEKQNTEE